jgi:ATP-dependent Clp protease protease subunit
MPKPDTTPDLKLVKPRYEIKAAANDPKIGEVWIYGVIGDEWDGLTAAIAARQIKALGELDLVNVYINSPGGSVFDGAAIYNILARHKARVIVHVDGMALSAASVIAMAGDEVRMASNAIMMIHDPWTLAIGSVEDMLKAAEILEKTKGTIVEAYVARTGGNAEEISALMSDETWLSADEALAAGFATHVDEAKKAAALAAPTQTLREAFKHAPDSLDSYLRPAAAAADSPNVTGEHTMTQDAKHDGGKDKTVDQQTPEPKLSIADQAKPFIEAFGDDLGAKYFAKGYSYETAKDEYAKHLAAESKAKDEQIEQLTQQLEAARAAAGHDQAVDFDPQDGQEQGESEEDAQLAGLIKAFDGDEKRARRALALRQKAKSN